MMPTSEEKKEIARLLRALRGWHAWEQHLAKGRIQIDGLKAALATKEHLPNKAERRISSPERSQKPNEGR